MATRWCKPEESGCPCHEPAEAPAPPLLPQRPTEGLTLLPVGEVPAIPTALVAPAAAAT